MISPQGEGAADAEDQLLWRHPSEVLPLCLPTSAKSETLRGIGLVVDWCWLVGNFKSLVTGHNDQLELAALEQQQQRGQQNQLR